jgi:UDP-arabinose 4-epimerase
MKPPVLVTGGAGFVGSHACKALAAHGYLPVTFDNLSRGHREAVRFGPLVEGDLLVKDEIEAALRAHRPVAVLHFAALAYVGESVESPLRYYQNNVTGLINLLEAMGHNSVGKLIFSSTCATYGLPSGELIREDDEQRPINPYGRSKLMGERIILDAARASGLRYAILRYFNAAGADLDAQLRESHDPETHVIPLAIDAAIGKGPPLRVFGADYPTKDGTCERDYIHVGDLADAHVAALAKLETIAALTVNLGAGKAVSVTELIAEVGRIAGREVPHVLDRRREGDPPKLVADIARAREILGFEPARSSLDVIIRSALRSRSASSGPGPAR